MITLNIHQREARLLERVAELEAELVSIRDQALDDAATVALWAKRSSDFQDTWSSGAADTWNEVEEYRRKNLALHEGQL